jgi:hypothetical protein
MAAEDCSRACPSSEACQLRRGGHHVCGGPAGGAPAVRKSSPPGHATAGGLMRFGCCEHSHVRCITAAYGLSPFMDHLLSERATSPAAPGDQGSSGLCPVHRPSPTNTTGNDAVVARQDSAAQVALAHQFESQRVAQTLPTSIVYRLASATARFFAEAARPCRGDYRPNTMLRTGAGARAFAGFLFR